MYGRGGVTTVAIVPWPVRPVIDNGTCVPSEARRSDAVAVGSKPNPWMFNGNAPAFVTSKGESAPTNGSRLVTVNVPGPSAGSRPDVVIRT
jgi:hypothetical protein